MHFIKSISSALVSALLVTSAFGQLTQVHRRINSDRDLSKRLAKPDAFILKYCSKAVPKKGGRDVEVRGLEARAKPLHYTEVPMGTYLGHKVEEGGLWSDSFGTCPGFVVTGTPATHGGLTRFLFHMSLGSGATFEQFAADVKQSGMYNMNAVLYTIDTRSTNPENHDTVLKQEAAELEKDYHHLAQQLEALCGRGRVGRRYHRWDSVGEMSIAPNNGFSVSS